MVRSHPLSAIGAALCLIGLSACGGEERPSGAEIELNSLFDADFSLIDHQGQPATDERFEAEGKNMVIYFGFTACPDVCPAALGKLTAALDRLEGDADEVQTLFITVDPKRDDVARLKAHLGYDDRILGLTGTEEQLAEARDALKVYAAERELEGSAMGYTVDHQRLIYITDAAGQPITAISDERSPEEIAAAISRQL